MGLVRKVIGLWGKGTGGTVTGLCSLLARQVYREWNAYGLRRDLSVACDIPSARVPLSVRALRDEDISAIFDDNDTGCSRRARLERMRRIAFFAERIPTPYIAVDLLHNRACFLQWLMTAESNNDIQRFFRGRFPILGRDEALLEYAYTPSVYRGNGIMPAAMAMIAALAADSGVRHVVTFVLRENTAALKGCAKAGFTPYVIRRDRHYCGRLIRRRCFIPVAGAAEARQQVAVSQIATTV